MRIAGKDVILAYIVSCLKLGEARGNILVKVGKKWGVSKSAFDRHLKIAKEQHAIERTEIESKLKDVSTQNAINDIKSGLKTKLERQLFYQSEIAVMEKQLRGEVEFTFVVGGTIKTSHADTKEGKKFMLPVQVQNDLRDTIKSYLAEISKMEGEYAATKTQSEVTIKKGGADKEDEMYID